MSSNNSKNLLVLKKLRAKQENKKCIDCPNRNPDWCSVPLGIWLCLDCAGHHRRLGTHISFVRSALYDTWSDEQMLHMKLGGNEKMRRLLMKEGLMTSGGVSNISPQEKYGTRPVKKYKKELKEKVFAQLDNGNVAEDTWEDIPGEESSSPGRLTDDEEEPQIEIKSMSKGKSKSMAKGKSIIRKSAKKQSSNGKSSLSLKKKKDSPAPSDKWNDWGENDWDNDSSDDDEDWENDDWDSPSSKKPSSTTSHGSSGSLSSRFGYQTNIREKNYVGPSTKSKHSSFEMESGEEPSRFQGYGSRGGYSAAVNSAAGVKSNRYTIDSLEDIQNVEDFKTYAQEQGVKLAELSREYTEVLREKGGEYVGDLSESISNWWKDFNS